MGLLVLVRHGQSQWNLENKFTGWVDVPITEKGREEARLGAEKIKGSKFDMAFTSLLKRAHETLEIVLKVIGQQNVPIVKDKALNERHYGDLQGLNKDEMRKKFGEEQVHIWRRSYDIAPPGGESLKDTRARALPFFTEKILPEVQAGKNVIVSAHGNSLRAIVMELDDISEKEIPYLELETGAPRVYEIDASGKVLHKTVHSLSGSTAES